MKKILRNWSKRLIKICTSLLPKKWTLINKFWRFEKGVYLFGELWVKLKDKFKINTQTKNSSIVSKEESKIISNEKDQNSLASAIKRPDYIELFKTFINENEGNLNESIRMKISWMKVYNVYYSLAIIFCRWQVTTCKE